MADTIPAEQSPAPVESTPQEPAQIQATPEVMAMMKDMTLAAIAQDTGEVARLEGLIKATSEVPPTVVEEVKPVEAVPLVEEVKPEETELPVVEGEQPPTPDQLRPRLHDPEDIAIAMIAKSKGITLAKAAKIYEGQQEEPKPAPVAEPVKDPTITALEVEVERLKTEYRQTYTADSMDEKLPDLLLSLTEVNASLIAERRAAKTLADVRTLTQENRVIETQAQFDRKAKVVEQEVAKAFPAFNDKNSPLSILMNGYCQQMQDPKHPDHAELLKPSAPKFLAEKAAKALGQSVQAPVTSQPVIDKPVARPAAGSKSSVVPTPELTNEQLIAAQMAKTLKSIGGGGQAPSSFLIIN